MPHTRAILGHMRLIFLSVVQTIECQNKNPHGGCNPRETSIKKQSSFDQPRRNTTRIRYCRLIHSLLAGLYTAISGVNIGWKQWVNFGCISTHRQSSARERRCHRARQRQCECQRPQQRQRQQHRRPAGYLQSPHRPGAAIPHQPARHQAASWRRHAGSGRNPPRPPYCAGVSDQPGGQGSARSGAGEVMQTDIQSIVKSPSHRADRYRKVQTVQTLNQLTDYKNRSCLCVISLGCRAKRCENSLIKNKRSAVWA